MNGAIGARTSPNQRTTSRGDHASQIQPGQALTEFALGLTVLLLLVVGLFQLAPAVMQSSQLTQAVRDGVSYGRQSPGDTLGIRKRVVQSLPAYYGTMTDLAITAMTPSQIAVTCAGSSTNCQFAQSGDRLTVEATITFEIMTSMFAGVFGGPILIKRSATTEIY